MLQDKKFNSLESAGNYNRELKKKIKERAPANDFPVTMAMPEQRSRYLTYCINLLEEQRGAKEFVILLKLLIQGHSLSQIAKYFKVVVPVVEIMEKEAIKRVKEVIHLKQKHGLPLVGGN